MEFLLPVGGDHYPVRRVSAISQQAGPEFTCHDVAQECDWENMVRPADFLHPAIGDSDFFVLGGTDHGAVEACGWEHFRCSLNSHDRRMRGPNTDSEVRRRGLAQI